MLHIYYGRGSYDRDRYIFKNLAKETLLIVPDQFTLQAERDAFFYLDDRKGFMDPEILSFSRLGTRILQEVGGGKRSMIDKQGRHMLLTKILKDCEGEMELYKGYSGNTAFIERINDFISEIKQQGVTPEVLRAKGEDEDEKGFLHKKLMEIQEIFTRYEGAIQGKYVDTEDYVSLYSEKIKESEKLKGKTVILYGFDYFTPKNLHVIGNLMKKVKDVKIFLTWDKEERGERIFAMGTRMIRQLKEMAERERVSWNVEPIPGTYNLRRPEALETLERELFALPAEKSNNARGITLVRAANYYSEGEAAALKVLKLVREKGYRFREIALICNDLETRGDIYRRVFQQHGMELFMDKKRDILHSPAVSYILSLMDIISKGYRIEDVLRLVKTGLTDLEPGEGEQLENYAQIYNINGKRWREPFEKGISEYGEEGVQLLDEYRGRCIGNIPSFAEEFKKGKTVQEKVETLYRYLKEVDRIPEKLESLMEKQLEDEAVEAAEETAQIWNVAVKIMDQLVAIIGEEKISMKNFSVLIQAGFEAVEMGILPPTVDGPVMGTMQRSRNSRIRATLILGANEGVLPSNVPGDGLFSEEERERLNARQVICKSDKLRREEEDLAIYKNLAKTGEEIWISCSASNEEGEAIEPSPVYNKVREIFNLEPEEDPVNEMGPETFAGGGASTLTHLSHLLENREEESNIKSYALETLLWYRENLPEEYRLLRQGAGHAVTAEKLGMETAAKLYKKPEEENFSFSPSRLERYGRCPFSHFVRYGLRPLERRKYQVDPMDIGDLAHRCLLHLSMELTEEDLEVRDEKSRWMNVSKKECQEMVEKIIAREGKEYREGLLFSDEGEMYRGERIKRLCTESAWMMIDHVRRGRVKTMKYEIPFGRSAVMEPINVPWEGGAIYIEGKIDRVDELEDNYIKVIDYKSGSDKYSEKEAKAGWKLQLFVYLRGAAGKGKKPAGAFYFHIAEPFIDMRGKKKEEMDRYLEAEMRKQFRMDGIMLNKPEVVKGVAGDFDRYSDIVSVEKTKKGLKSSGKFLEEEDFKALIEEVSRRMDGMCREIAEGRIAIKPGKSGAFSACTYCQYRGICKFDESIEGCNYVRI